MVPRSLHEEVIKVAHGTVGSGNFGVLKTLKRVRQSFYWGLIGRDVEDFCWWCDGCTAWKGPSGWFLTPLQQFPIGGPMKRVRVRVRVDISNFPCLKRGNRFALMSMDYFTKWPEDSALSDQEAERVIDALVDYSNGKPICCAKLNLLHTHPYDVGARDQNTMRPNNQI